MFNTSSLALGSVSPRAFFMAIAENATDEVSNTSDKIKKVFTVLIFMTYRLSILRN
jgi:hypothetical protein